jgi:hypothetical protein
MSVPTTPQPVTTPTTPSTPSPSASSPVAAVDTSDHSADARLVGGAWRNDDFIFEFDEDGQLKLLTAAGAAKCPYTVDTYVHIQNIVNDMKQERGLAHVH